MDRTSGQLAAFFPGEVERTASTAVVSSIETLVDPSITSLTGRLSRLRERCGLLIAIMIEMRLR